MGASVPEVSTTLRAAAATSRKASAGLSAHRQSCVACALPSSSPSLHAHLVAQGVNCSSVLPTTVLCYAEHLSAKRYS